MKQHGNPYDALKKLFHEPNRLAIVSALCASNRGLSFSEIKRECDLTDGNLSRHLKVLQEAGVVKVTKTFVNEKPRTTVVMTPVGLDRFGGYLAALEEVLEKARKSARNEGRVDLGVAVRGQRRAKA